jgi:hypothetical protein
VAEPLGREATEDGELPRHPEVPSPGHAARLSRALGKRSLFARILDGNLRYVLAILVRSFLSTLKLKEALLAIKANFAMSRGWSAVMRELVDDNEGRQFKSEISAKARTRTRGSTSCE